MSNDANGPPQPPHPARPESAGGAPGAASANEQDGAHKRIEELEAAVLRARADAENVRKRAAREAEKTRQFALERFARDLLPVKDSLERGLLAATEAQTDEGSLREGTELTLRQLEQVFAANGIEAINPLGERFDPERHEAMSVTPRTDVPPDTVVAVFEKGYTLNGRVLRPARVLVSAAAPGPGPRPGPEAGL